MLDELIAAIDDLVEDRARLASSETILELQRQRQRLEAVAARAVAAWDARQGWADDDARSGPAWLAARARVPVEAARRTLRLGRALRDLPGAEQAWLDGEVDGAHVAALAATRTHRTADLLARDEAMLVGSAATLPFARFQRVLAYWLQHADPDGVERDAERQVEDRRLDVSTTFRGAVVGDLVLDPIRGTIVTETLDAIERQLFEAEWADARAQLGREPLVTELARTPKQRRADALVEMAVRARTAPSGGRRPAPLFTVLVGYETFAGRICELANGIVVTPGSLAAWLDGSDVERVVFEGPSRVIDVGEHQRFFTGATRRAVEVLDLECFHDTCDVRAGQAEIDHVVPASAGGPTTTANGRVACGFHNRRRHKRRPGD